MAEIAPLTPLRYDLSKLADGLASVVAPPYDVISREQRAALAAQHRHNVVRLILPDGEGDAKYGVAADILKSWRAEGVLARDEEPAFYRYDQAFVPPGAPAGSPSIRRRGFLALVRLAPFSERIVLPHERTLSGPKEDRLKLFRATRTNLSPGFMLYRDAKGELGSALDTAQALAEFTTADGVHHALAKVRSPEAIRAIVAGVARSTLLIADGHHRYETAVRYSQEAGAAAGAGVATERGEHRYFMSFLANGDDPNLVVFPTHRLVHSLASFSLDDLLRRAAATFDAIELPRGAAAEVLLDRLRTAAGAEKRPSVVCAVPDGRSAVLTLKADARLDAHPTLGPKPEVLRRTDVTVLHAGIFEAILGITPEAQVAKTNLWYVQDGAESLAELRAGVRGQALFLMNPTPVAAVRDVAEAGEVMPQKSTFFYPKVLTGLAIHTLDPSRPVHAI
jgi:uncharacterized protein (DUF1015 family)